MAENLTTIYRAKEFMGLDQTDSDKDAVLTLIVNAVSRQIAEQLDREPLELTTHKKWLDGGGGNRLRLPDFPILGVYGVALQSYTVARLQYSGSGPFASCNLDGTNLTLVSADSDGSDTITDITLAGKTLTELQTSVSAVSGWALSIVSGKETYPATQLRPMSSGDAKSTDDIELEAPDEYWEARVTSEADDTIELLHSDFPCGHSNIFVWYKAGYTLPTEASPTTTTVPSGLELIALKIVKAVFESTEVSDLLRSEKIGDYQYTVKDSDVIDGGASRNFVTAHAKELWPWSRKRL